MRRQLTDFVSGAGGPLLAKEFPGADVSVVSFAAPRAGNAEFQQAFATLIGSSMRFQYNYDAVPCVPMWYLGYARTTCLPFRFQ